MKKYIIILYFIITNNFIVVNAQDLKSLCGPRCLLFMCNYFNVNTSLKELCKLSGYKNDKGTTFLGLYNAAKSKGLPVIPIKINIGQLSKIENPSIAYLNESHFIIVNSSIDNYVILQDPPSKSFKVTKNFFKNHWNGEVLVFDYNLKMKMASKINKAIVSSKGPHISISNTTYFAGIVTEGKKLSHVFNFKNIGTEPLEIKTRSTCSCSSFRISGDKIPAGGSGFIEIKYNTNGRKGKINNGVVIITNDPENRFIKLTIAADIKSYIKVVPEKIWLGEVVTGEKIIREIHIVDSGDSTLEVKDIKTPKGIFVNIQERKKNINSIPILLTINIDDVPCDFEEQIIIQTNDKNRPEIPVKISSIVVGEVKAFPPIVFFGETEPEKEVMRESTISSTNGKNLTITKVEAQTPFISTELQQIEYGKKYKLITKLFTNEKNITVRDTLLVFAEGKNEPILEIPVYARVVGGN